jgi:uncharacterized phage protein (TIGR02218 family)
MTLALTPVQSDLLTRSGATRCRCYAVTRVKDGGTHFWTTHDRPITVLGQTYTPLAGATAGAIRRTANLGGASSSLSGPVSSEVKLTDLFAQRFDGALIVEQLVDWEAAHIGPIWEWNWTVRQAPFDEFSWTFELSGIQSRLAIRRGNTWRRTCMNALGDAVGAGSRRDGFCRATINVAPFRVTGTIASVQQGGRRFTITSPDFAPDDSQGRRAENWYSYGRVQYLGGRQFPNSSLVRGVVYSSAVTGASPNAQCTVETYTSFPFPVTIGHPIVLITGCDKRASTCIQKFQRYTDFRGAPEIPGSDRAVRAPDG